MAPPTTAEGLAAARNKKRAISGKAAGAAASSLSAASKKIKVGAGKAVAVKHEATTPDAVESASASVTMRERFLKVFETRKQVSNADLKQIFGEREYLAMAPIITELAAESRILLSQGVSGGGADLFYSLLSEKAAQQFYGLDTAHKMVYQVIERAGNNGIWTRDIKNQTNIQMQALNKIFKALESRQLIKRVKSVTQKLKSLYMLYDLTPSKELTGGVWYSNDLEFDHEFIIELRNFLLQCVRRLNSCKGVTVQEILEKMQQHKVSKVELTTTEVAQLVQTLIFDYLVEEDGANDRGQPLFVAARRVTPMCEFTWWDALDADFSFRKIRFEDGVEISAHEPHYQTGN
jgi:DNA-directed RNA polymerase III subunit RPC6